jgi:hypothetical protein
MYFNFVYKFIYFPDTQLLSSMCKKTVTLLGLFL